MIAMNRRGFLTAILATCAAPAIVRASSLMPLVVRPAIILFGDGIHDDTRALQALIDGCRVFEPDGMAASAYQTCKRFLLTDTVRIQGRYVYLGGSVLSVSSVVPVVITNSHFQYAGPPERPMLLWEVPDARSE